MIVPGNRGTVLDVSCSKAIFTGIAGAAPSPCAANLHLTLFPADREAPLDEHALSATADYFLPRLLQYRLDQAQKVQESRFPAADLKFPTRELARKLGACIQGDAELALRVVPLLLPEDNASGLCNLDCAIIEVLWPRLHSSPQETAGTTKMRIEAELTAEVNTYLLSCGETVQYTREEVGIRVASLEFRTKRTNAGSVLLLNRRLQGTWFIAQVCGQRSGSAFHGVWVARTYQKGSAKREGDVEKERWAGADFVASTSMYSLTARHNHK